MEPTPDFDGPAEPGSSLRNVLDLLRMRGCRVVYDPPSDGVMETYKCYYPDNPARARLFYPDMRGAEQALGFLMELNTGRKAGEYMEVVHTRTHTMTKIVGT